MRADSAQGTKAPPHLVRRDIVDSVESLRSKKDSLRAPLHASEMPPRRTKTPLPPFSTDRFATTRSEAWLSSPTPPSQQSAGMMRGPDDQPAEKRELENQTRRRMRLLSLQLQSPSVQLRPVSVRVRSSSETVTGGLVGDRNQIQLHVQVTSLG